MVTQLESAQAWKDRDIKFVSQVYSRYSDLVIERGEGSHIFTVDGRKILDLGCGIAVTSLGHCHPEVVAAVHKQVDMLWHTSVTASNVRLIELAELLTSVASGGLDQVFFANSGAEAVEGALKLARRATGRTDFIAFHGGFHGRTYGAITLTASKAKYHAGIGPFLPGVHHVDYPYCFRNCTHLPGESCPIAAGEQIERLFKTLVPPESVAGIIVEPILGEGGYVVPPENFLPALRENCNKHGIMLIADEVQSGLCRSGKWFASQHTGVVPDIICVAKSLANGLPISAILAKRQVMEAWHPGEHGTTFGGNAVACAAAIATIGVMQKEKLADRSAQLGEKLMQRFAGWQEKYPALADVRGKGLMIGLEFMDQAKRPLTAVVSKIREASLANDVMILSCGVDDSVIRLIPPLNIDEDELNRGLDVVESAIAEVTA